MAFTATVNGIGAFGAVVDQQSAFLASMANMGPKGDTGATGPAGVVAATAPIVYTSGTQTVSMDTSYFLRSPAVAGTDGQIVSWDAATSRPLWIDNQARTLFATVRNETGATLSKGTVVYINGASGNKATVTKAQANSDATSSQTFAVIYADIANNQNGTAIVAGELAGLNTSAYSDGAALYLSPSTAGAFTTTKPSAPDHLVYVATVTRSHATQGTIEVRIQNGYELEELHNVAIASVADKNLLVYESATSLWKNKSFATLDLLTGTSAASTYLAKSSNLSDLSSASTARTNLGLGTMAVAASADYLAKSDNLSGLASASTARTNLGLGTMAVETAADYLTKAGNLSGLASTSTARTNLGLGTMAVETASNYALLASPTFTGDPKAPTPATSDNDTSIATTAFVNSYCPAASTTASGKVELATDSEAITKTDAVRAVTPSNLVPLALWMHRMQFIIGSFNAATSGTGGTNDSLALSRRQVAPTSTGAGYVAASHPWTPGRGQYFSNNINWTKRVRLYARITYASSSPSNDSIYRLTLGEVNTTYTGDPTVRSIGIKITGSGAVNLITHDGSGLTTIATSFTPTVNQAFDVLLESDGSGTVTCTINDSLVGTSTGGPKTLLSGTGLQNVLMVKIENLSTFTSGGQALNTYAPSAEYLP